MFAEIHAESTAKKLEAIILRTMKDGKYSNIRSAVCAVSRYELVEWYYDECGETFGSYNPHPEILKKFPPKDE